MLDKNRLEYLLRRAIERQGSIEELDELRELLQQYNNGETAREIASLLAAYQATTLSTYTVDSKEVMITRILASDTTGEQMNPEVRVLNGWKR